MIDYRAEIVVKDVDGNLQTAFGTIGYHQRLAEKPSWVQEVVSSTLWRFKVRK